jgi:hypothetical protein
VPQGLRVKAPSPSPASARSHQPPCLREADKDPPAPAFESNHVAKLLPTLLSMSPATIATPPRPESAKKSPPPPIHSEPLLARLFLSIRLMPHCNLSFLELYEHPKANSNLRCSLPITERRCAARFSSPQVTGLVRWVVVYLIMPGMFPTPYSPSPKEHFHVTATYEKLATAKLQPPRARWPRWACPHYAAQRPGSTVDHVSPGPSRPCQSMGQKGPRHDFFFYLLSKLFSDLNIHRNSISLLKYIENRPKLRKIQNTFCWNPLGWILAIDSTQLHFVQYCLLENFLWINHWSI